MSDWGSDEIFRPGDRRKASSAASRGEIRRIAQGLYTTNLDEPPERLLRRRWAEVAAIYHPHSVIVDRSAVTAAPEADGSLFLDVGRSPISPKRTDLPGLSLRPRNGPGPVEGDMPYFNLYFSSEARGFLDNLRPSRKRNGVSRTLSRSDLEERLDRIARTKGDPALNEIRDRAREVAPKLGAREDFELLDEIIGTLLGTRELSMESDVARARQRGLGYDPERLHVLELIRTSLASLVLPTREDYPDPQRQAAFYEAYFSNWIEGTEFEIEEAGRIIFDGEIPSARPADAHDVRGTFEAINSTTFRAAAPRTFEELETYLRGAHRLVMGGRPEALPGEYKQRPNRAGSTVFVHPDLVRGTLAEGFRLRDSLEPGLKRSVYSMFLVSEVHPFTDGNGRISRLLMNAELSDAGLARIMIPLVFRDEYLTALRAATNRTNPEALWKMLDRAQRWACSLDWTRSPVELRADIERTNALVHPYEAEALNIHLRDH